MGLIAVGLGPSDQRVLQTLEPEVISTLRKACAFIEGGQGKPQSVLWFGDKSAVWMKRLSSSLNRMASIVNTKPIQVMGTNWQLRESGTSAAARSPRGGWNTYTNMSQAQNRNFNMRLDVAWNAKPLYRPGGTPGLSKFHTIVHELTHLILNTDDVTPAYGEANCKRKALKRPTAAKRNADNWAFFVDDMRNPVVTPPVDPVTSAVWLEKTKRGVLHTRSGDLKRLDTALAAYEAQATTANAQILTTAFNSWYTRNPRERTARNIDRVVDKLKAYVESLA